MRLAATWILIGLTCTGLLGQLERIQFPVSGFDDEKIDAWKGGISSPQFSNIDLNLDGVMDLVLFDRRGDYLMPFISSSSGDEYGYSFAPEYATQFPKLNDWMLLRDYNRDGAMDIFTQTSIPGIPGIAVYQGSIGSDGYEWTLVEFPEASFDVLQIPAGNGTTNLYSSSIDLPAIRDFDGDGDLDIAGFESSGGFIYYYRNFAEERGLGADALDFEVEDVCWGKIFESDFNEEISLSDNPQSCASGLTEDDAEIQFRHAGSALEAFDADDDGLLDMVVGDLSSSQLILLNDNGTINNSHVTEQELGFPASAGSVNIPEFVAGFYLDISGDGVSDFVAAANAQTPTETVNVAWYYENVGSETDPELGFRQNDLFVENMLDFGEDAAPAFMDYNQDGLLDLIVGTSGMKLSNGNRQARLYLLLNEGSTEEPSFVLNTDDLGDLARFGEELFAYTPAVGDLDGDGDDDLLVGNSQGTLFYLENTAGAGMPTRLAAARANYADIDVNNFSSPSIADINRDGLMDIIVGERNGNNDVAGNRCGNLNYFQNQGTEGSPSFTSDEEQAPNTNCLGEVLVERSEIFSYGASPTFVELGGSYHLFVGSDAGIIQYYDDIDDNATGAFSLVDSFYGGQNEGFRTQVALADIDDDGLVEMLVGNSRGGLSAFRAPLTSDGVQVSTSDPVAPLLFELFPNPTDGRFVIRQAEPYTYRVVTLMGQILEQGASQGDTQLHLDQAGIYFLILDGANGARGIKRLIVD